MGGEGEGVMKREMGGESVHANVGKYMCEQFFECVIN